MGPRGSHLICGTGLAGVVTLAASRRQRCYRGDSREERHVAPMTRLGGWRGAHAERSVSVSAAARAFTWRRTAAVVLPGIRSTSMVAVRVFHDQVPATRPSTMTHGQRLADLVERPSRRQAAEIAAAGLEIGLESGVLVGEELHSRGDRLVAGAFFHLVGEHQARVVAPGRGDRDDVAAMPAALR